jgi:hypothetical protein
VIRCGVTQPFQGFASVEIWMHFVPGLPKRNPGLKLANAFSVERIPEDDQVETAEALEIGQTVTFQCVGSDNWSSGPTLKHCVLISDRKEGSDDFSFLNPGLNISQMALRERLDILEKCF